MGIQINRSLFQVPFWTVPGGRKVMGQMTAPETDLGTQRFVPGRRALITPYGTRVPEKTVIRTKENQHYLIGSAAENEAQRLNYTVTYLFPMTHQVSVSRSAKVTDPVTGQIVANPPANIFTNVWVGLESMLEARDNMAVPEKEYRIVTGAAVEENDILSNGMQVKMIQEFLGVYVGVVR